MVFEENIRKWVKEKLKEGADPLVIKQVLKERGYDINIMDEVQKSSEKSIKLEEGITQPKKGGGLIKILIPLAVILGVLVFTLLYYFPISKIVPVSNPSFEDGAWNAGILGNWGFEAGSPEEKITWVDDIAYDGNKSVRVDFLGVSWVVIPHDFIVGELRLESSTYQVSFYVRSLNMTKICVGYDARSKEDDSFLHPYECPGGVISFPADGKWHYVTHKFDTSKLPENTYGVFKFDISGCDPTKDAPYCEGELNIPGTIWIDGPVKIEKV